MPVLAAFSAALSPKWCPPGMFRSQPARNAAVLSCMAPQSVTAMPSKPHSSRSMSVSRRRLSLQYSPFTLLYAHMTEPGRLSRTAISNAVRYISLSVRSSMMLSEMNRSRSCEFAA